MNLRPYQLEAAAALRAEIAKGGSLTFSMPIGCGRSIIVAEAVRAGGPVAFVSRHRELVEQMRDTCRAVGATNVKCVWMPSRAVETADFSDYAVVILSESHLPWPEIDHPCVIQQGFIRGMPLTMGLARGDEVLALFVTIDTKEN